MNETNNSGGAVGLVGKFIVFFEQGCPRNTLYFEEAAYEVTGLVGTKKLTIKPVHLPLGHEVKVRTQTIIGDHIAAVFPDGDKALAALHTIRAAKRQVAKLESETAHSLATLTCVGDLHGDHAGAGVTEVTVAAGPRTRTRPAPAG